MIDRDFTSHLPIGFNYKIMTSSGGLKNDGSLHKHHQK